MDEFVQVQQQGKQPGSVGWWDRVLPELTAEQVEGLRSAARSPEISHRTISVVLGKWGFQVSPGSVGHWRRNHVG